MDTLKKNSPQSGDPSVWNLLGWGPPSGDPRLTLRVILKVDVIRPAFDVMFSDKIVAGRMNVINVI